MYYSINQTEPGVQHMWNVIKNLVLKVSNSMIKQPPKSKPKNHWFHNKCTIELRNKY